MVGVAMNWLNPDEVKAWLAGGPHICGLCDRTYRSRRNDPCCTEDANEQFVRALAASAIHQDDCPRQYTSLKPCNCVMQIPRLLRDAMDGGAMPNGAVRA